MPAPSAVQGIGQANAAGTRDALYLKVFSGEVLGSLDPKLMLLDTFTTKQALAGAKTARFPTYGDATASYHVPGEDLIRDGYLSNVAFGEHVIHADRVLQASDFVDDLEEILNDWNHRVALAEKMTTAVQEQVEDTLFRLVAKGSGFGAGTTVEGTQISGWDTGQADHNGGVAITAQDVYDKIFEFAAAMDANNIPRTGRYAAVTPQMFFQLMRLNGVTAGVASAVVDKDLVGGQNGDLAMPPMSGLWIGGVFVMNSNFIPTTSNTSDTSYALSGNGNDYRVDMTKGFQLIMWHQSAIGTVRVKAPQFNADRIPNRLGRLLVVSQAMGHNVIRPEACFTFRQTA